MFYLELFRALEHHRVRYLLVGGLAMNLHGVPRMTMDIDLVVALEPDNVDRFVAAARTLGLRPQAPVPLEALKDPVQRQQWVEQKHTIAFALGGRELSSPTVDVVIVHPLDFDAAYARGDIRDAEGTPIRLASIDDMITLKQKAGRRQDLDDIEHLRRLRDRNG